MKSQRYTSTVFAFRRQSAPEGSKEVSPLGMLTASVPKLQPRNEFGARCGCPGVAGSSNQAAEGKKPRRVASIHSLEKLLWFQTKASYFKGFEEGRKDKRDKR